MRTYGESCAVAHALDLVGERWALLIVRELLYGPKRFSDLRAGIPRATPAVLTQRLRELEQSGVLRHIELGPPVGAGVYELTDWGRRLEPVLVHLGRWGVESSSRDLSGPISPDAVMLALQSHYPDDASGPTGTCNLRVGDSNFIADLTDGRLDIRQGIASHAEATFEADSATAIAVIAGRVSLDKAVDTQRVRIDGDIALLRHIFQAQATSRD